MATPASKSQTSAAPVAAEVNAFDQLLDKGFQLKTDQARSAVQSAVRTLAEQALAETAVISGNSVETIEALISAIDRKLSEQLSVILHHDDFRKLEGSWRGLHHLVMKTETDEHLKIRVLNTSKKEVSKTLKRFPGAAFDQSPLFKKIYENQFGAPGGEPFGVLVGDFEFDHTPPDVELLAGIAKIAATAHAPFITAAAPSLMNMDSWQELQNPRDLTKIFQAPEYVAWRSLRDSEDARYLGLTMPRFLSRLPYGAKTSPVDEFDFEEDSEGADHSKYVWSNSAYAMATNIARAFKKSGWCAQIRGVESGGIVEDLPVHTFNTDEGGTDSKCPTEIAITDRREAELGKLGLLPLSHWKNTDYAVFIGGQSLQKPQKYDDADATANANLAARLPYLFATCRFAHYLKCIVRDKIGSYKERADMERWLNDWIMNYVTHDKTASDAVKAEFPLADAQVVVEDVPGNPGYYTSKFYLRPHFQLEGLTVSLRLVTKLPKEKLGGG